MRCNPLLRFALLCALLSGCDLYFSTSSVDEQDPAGTEDSPSTDPSDTAPPDTLPPPNISFDLVACDDLGFYDAEWLQTDSEHFRFHYLPGTSAENDILAIQATREQAYADISEILNLSAQPILDVYLSPSRHAAQVHGLTFGRAFPGYDRYEVIYTGATNSFEYVHYGHLIASSLAYYAAPDNRQHLHILGVGINEMLDGAARDMHEAYALRLNAGEESMTYLADLGDGDLWGRNRGRAGSLVSFLVERYGWATFLDIYRLTNIEWSEGCYRHDGSDCIDSASRVTDLLSAAIQAVTGDGWSEVRVMWAEAVLDALSRTYFQLPLADISEVNSMLSQLDRAVSSNDSLLYRSVMDGFYCVWANEDERMNIARRVVESIPVSTSRLIAAYPIGINNFDEAVAFVERTDALGVVSVHRLSLEHFPQGWRLTWTDAWR